ncbi:MAG: hypothetical protein ACYTGN_09255 [Planctomycetota bacterium]
MKTIALLACMMPGGCIAIGCVLEGTPVATPRGDRPIEHLLASCRSSGSARS